jgi:hypothetical protein
MTLRIKMRAILIILLVIISVVAGLFIWGWIASNRVIEEIKPYVTYSRLMFVAAGCDEYKKEKGVWPTSLAQLHAFRVDLNDPWTRDSWGRDVVLVPYDESLSYGEVISYGRDGKIGGSGPDRDLVVRFPCEANTNWNEQVGSGLKKPQRVP